MPLARDDAGAGPPILLVHGFPTTRRLWSGVVPRLVAAGFRVVAPDLLGYGESPSTDDIGMRRQSRELLALLDELSIEQAFVVAHDVGTAAAQILAVDAPARISGLVLMDGVYETEWVMGPIESIRAWDPAQAARLQPVLARRLKSIRELLSAYAGEEGGRRLIHAARCLDPMETSGITEKLRATGVPMSVVWGASDDYLPVETVGRPLAAVLGAELTILPGGHFLPADNPEGVAHAVSIHCKHK
jgi:pimeloyl-ACP methyl ester carboxylesterase